MVFAKTARSSWSPPPLGVTSIRDGTWRSTSKCVCNRHFTVPLSPRRFITDAVMIRGIAVISVASTRVSVPARPRNRSSRDPAPWGDDGSWPLNSWMISIKRSGSKTVAASDSDPSAAR